MRQVILSCACAGLSFAAGMALARAHEALTPVEPRPPALVQAPAPPAIPAGLTFTPGASEWADPNARDGARVGGREFLASDGARLQYSFEELGDAEAAHQALHRHARSLASVADDGGHALHGRCAGGGRLSGETAGSNGSYRAVVYWTRGGTLFAVNGPTLAHVRALADWGAE